MNIKALQIVIILLITFAVLSWIRSDGEYDFDIRSIIPFMRGSDISIYDWGGLALILYGLWGLGRLRGGARTTIRPLESEPEPIEEYEPIDEFEDEVIEDDEQG